MFLNPSPESVGLSFMFKPRSLLLDHQQNLNMESGSQLSANISTSLQRKHFLWLKRLETKRDRGPVSILIIVFPGCRALQDTKGLQFLSELTSLLLNISSISFYTGDKPKCPCLPRIAFFPRSYLSMRGKAFSCVN